MMPRGSIMIPEPESGSKLPPDCEVQMTFTIESRAILLMVSQSMRVVSVLSFKFKVESWAEVVEKVVPVRDPSGVTGGTVTGSFISGFAEGFWAAIFIGEVVATFAVAVTCGFGVALSDLTKIKSSELPFVFLIFSVFVPVVVFGFAVFDFNRVALAV